MVEKRTKYDALLRMARKGPIRARDLDAERIPRVYLRRLADRGDLVRTDRGIYRLAGAEASEHASLADVAIRVPHATVCLYSALQFHGLTTQVSHAVWIMIDRTRRAPRIENPPVEVVRASGNARRHGIQVQRIDGVDVEITTPAKTVADCFKYRNKIGLDVAIEALREGWRAKSFTMDELWNSAKVCRVRSVIQPYMEMVAE